MGSHDHHGHHHDHAGHAHDHDHGHGHDHSHAHGPGHAHVHAPASFGKAFAIGISLNVALVVAEAVYGYIGNSTALLADAGHNLSDVLGLVLAYGAWVLARRKPSPRFTYGLRGSSILAALFNAVLRLVACGAIALGAIQRFTAPEPVAGVTVMVVAAIGIVINLATALLFASGRKRDINIRGAFLHMTADAAVSAGVVVAGLITLRTGWLWIDPATSLVIVVVILIGTWGLLRDSLAMAVHGVPAGIDPRAVRASLAAIHGVERVHHLHIWPMSTTETALTAHLVIPGGHPGDAFLARIAHDLDHDFRISHATIQIETGDLHTEHC